MSPHPRPRRKPRSSRPALESLEGRLLLTVRPPYNTGTGFFVLGNEIYDADGNPFRMRGLNVSQAWGTPMNGLASIPEVAKTGANAVRLPFSATGLGIKTSPTMRMEAVQEAIANGLVPVVEEHSATLSSDPGALDAVVDAWLEPGNVAWLKQYERYVVLNIANEWGGLEGNGQAWADAYIAAVHRIRDAGINCMLMIDAPNGGQSLGPVLQFAQQVQQADPQRNIVFSCHMYWGWVTEERPWLVGIWGDAPWDVRTELTRAVDLGIPLVIGEFAWQGSNYSAVSYDTRRAVQAYEDLGIGWLAWGWNWMGPYDSLVSETRGVYFDDADLWDAGQFFVNDPTLGLKALAAPSTLFAAPPPRLAPVDDQAVAAGGSLQLTLSSRPLVATAAASPTLTYSVTTTTLAAWYDENFLLDLDPSGFHTNARGMGEKYIRGKYTALPEQDVASSYWYYLLPNGDLCIWLGLGQDFLAPGRGVFLANLGAAYYDDPMLLTDASASPAPAPAPVAVAGAVVTITPAPGTLGTFVAIATVDNGHGIDRQTFRVHVGGAYQPPLLTPVAYRTAVGGQGIDVGLTLDRFAAGRTFTYAAQVMNQAAWLDQTYGFLVDPSSYATNARGQGEKYVLASASTRGYPGPGPFRYYILPNGDLYEQAPPYDGPTALNGVLVAHLGPDYYDDPTLLTQQGGAAVPVTLAVSGNVVGITPAPGYSGTFVVVATVDDGRASNSVAFKVTATPLAVAAPTLDPIPDLVIAPQPGPGATVVLGGHSADPSRTLTYSATAEPLLAWLKRTYGLARPAGGEQFDARGQKEKYLVGVVSARGFYNYPPVFYVLPNGDLYELEPPWVGPLRGVKVANVGTDAYEDPSLLWDAPAEMAPADALLSIAGNSLLIQPAGPAGSTFVVTATVSDGEKTARRTFLVALQAQANTPPTLDPIPDQSLDAAQGYARTVTLQGHDPDPGQVLGYSATAEPLPYWLRRTYGLYRDPTGYHEDAKGQGEKYLRGTARPEGAAADPWYYLLPDGTLHLGPAPDSPDPLAGDLVATPGLASYYDPSTLWNAAFAPVRVTLSVSGNTLSVVPFATAGETFVITATVGDGQAEASRAFQFTYIKGAAPYVPPAFVPVAPVTIRSGLPEKVVLSGESTSADPYYYFWADVSLPRLLQQRIGLFRGSADYNADARGQGEKYLLGYQSFHGYDYGGFYGAAFASYYILPNGDLYEQLPVYTAPTLQGTFIAHLGQAVYDNPTLLTSPTSDVPVYLRMHGADLTLRADHGYNGSFTVYVVVHDNTAQAIGSFQVQAVAPTLQRPADQAANGGQTLAVPLSGSSAAGPITYSARVVPLAYQFRQDYRLYKDPRGYATNTLGQQEKWIFGMASAVGWSSPNSFLTRGDSYSYYLLPNGDFYELTTTNPLSGVLLASFGPAVYEDPSLLWAAPNVAFPGSVAIEGDQLLITPAPFAAGPFAVVVTAEDAQGGRDRKTFRLQVTPAPSAGSATFVGSDATTAGSWRGVYGGDGHALAGGPTATPDYAAMDVTGAWVYTWANPTTDPRALQTPGSSTRQATTWYGDQFQVTLDLGATPRRVAAYMLDFDRNARAQRVEVIDGGNGAVLDAREVSSFEGGRYLIWELSGRVTLRFTRLAGANAVLSGLFFGGASEPLPPGGTATYVGADETTSGSWQGAYGGDGYALAVGPASAPPYGSWSVVGAAPYVWADPTTDPRALQTPGSNSRQATTWYADRFEVALDIDGGPRRVAVYMVDFDRNARAQRVEVLDGNTGAVLDAREVSSFEGGRYLIWELSGRVTLRFTRLAGANAVLSGLFFGGPSAPLPPGGAATYVGADETTSGSWQGAYGGDGYALAVGPASAPPYGSWSVVGAAPYVWADPTTDPRALQIPGSASRQATTWYGDQFDLELDLGEAPRRVAIYMVDFDRNGRSQRVEVLDGNTGAVLDAREVVAFEEGTYLIWELSGRVTLRIKRTAGANAVVSGIFFGGA